MRAWDDFIKEQEKHLGPQTVQKWLSPLKVSRFDACNLYLEAPDSFFSIWFEEHIRPLIDRGFTNNNGKKIRVHLSIAKRHEIQEEKTKEKKGELPSLHFKLVFDEIEESAKFEHFISSQSNLLAYKLLLESCQPSTSPHFNPIYLYGRLGVGKSHLLMAAASQLKSVGENVIYVRAETFTEHVVNAIRSGEIQTFRKAYRKVDALLIDDVQIFSRKGATQEELFHTFNTLHTEGKQIIFAADCSPQELKFIEPRLVSRFEWGIVVPLHPLEGNDLKILLHKKAEKVGFPLESNIADFLLGAFPSNVKALLRALDALILRTHLNKVKEKSLLTVSTVKKILSDLILEEEKAVLTPSKIIKTVAEHYGIRIEDILSKSQSRDNVLPRQIAMHLCRKTLKMPYMKIGEIFTRDHSTVMSSIKLIQQNLEQKNHEIASPHTTILKKLEV